MAPSPDPQQGPPPGTPNPNPNPDQDQAAAAILKGQQADRAAATKAMAGATVFSNRELNDPDGAALRRLQEQKSGTSVAAQTANQQATQIATQTVAQRLSAFGPGGGLLAVGAMIYMKFKGEKGREEAAAKQKAALEEVSSTWYVAKEVDVGGKPVAATFKTATDLTRGSSTQEMRSKNLKSAFDEVTLIAGKAEHPTPLEANMQTMRNLEQVVRNSKDPKAALVSRNGEYILKLSNGREEKLGPALTQADADADRLAGEDLSKKLMKIGDPAKEKTTEKTQAKRDEQKRALEEYESSSQAMKKTDQTLESLRRVLTSLPDAAPERVEPAKPPAPTPPTPTQAPVAAAKPEAPTFDTKVIHRDGTTQFHVMAEAAPGSKELKEGANSQELVAYLGKIPHMSPENQKALAELLNGSALKTTGADGKTETPYLSQVAAIQSKHQVEFTIVKNDKGEKATVTFDYVAASNTLTPPQTALVKTSNANLTKAIDNLKKDLGEAVF